MSTFPLKVVTPDGLIFDGEAERLIVRTTEGDIAILARHIDCVAALGMGRATIVDANGNYRYASCIGGMLSVSNNTVTLVPTTFEWSDKIDAERAERAKERAESILKNKDSSAADIRLAEAKLRRALVRKSVVGYK